MEFLVRKEVSGFRQDIRQGEAKQVAEKTEFEKKLLGGLGDDMENTLEHPETVKEQRKSARKFIKKKRFSVWSENFRKIFGLGNKNR